MKFLKAENVYSAFFDRLQSSCSRVLLLDYDGTLAPFQVDRARAFPYPEVSRLVSDIAQKGSRVVFVSGRPAHELSKLTGINPHPETWGNHGGDHLYPDGRYEVIPLPEPVRFGLSMAAEKAREEGLESRMERKSGGIAVHWRGLDPTGIAQLRTRTLELWRPLCAQYALHILEFDGGLEIRPEAITKGSAVQVILKEAGTDASVAYLGDDQTDEDAFRVLNGKGLTALVCPQLRPTAADIWLQPPQEMIEFLKKWLQIVGGEA